MGKNYNIFPALGAIVAILGIVVAASGGLAQAYMVAKIIGFIEEHIILVSVLSAAFMIMILRRR